MSKSITETSDAASIVKTDIDALAAVQELENVKVTVTSQIEHHGVRFEEGETVTLPRLDANFHIKSGNCVIVK